MLIVVINLDIGISDVILTTGKGALFIAGFPLNRFSGFDILYQLVSLSLPVNNPAVITAADGDQITSVRPE